MPRKALDGTKLAADIDRLEREDQASPPAAQPSLMDAVRGLAGYIETRAKLGWTDPMIAVVLTEAGYPISADTLCSYRKRLRDEGLMAPLKAAGPKSKMWPLAGVTAAMTTPTVEAISATDIVAPAAAAPATAGIPAAHDAATPRAPPDLIPTPSPARVFRVDPTRLPPDRA